MSRVNGPAKMTLQRAKFLFDLNGFVCIPEVLSAQEVACANASIDAHSANFVERTGRLRNTKGDTALAGDNSTGRQDLAGMLGWESHHDGEKNVFRKCLNHHKLVPYLHLLLGKGYRLDHAPLVIQNQKGSEGFSLHGGPVTNSGRFNSELQYSCRNGDLYNSLLGVSFALTDVNAGDGGYCVVKGSHKMNFPLTKEMLNGEDEDFLKICVDQPVVNAGDVILFSEATVHGCLAWKRDYHRRIALYRFSPANLAFARGYSEGWPEECLEGMTEEERAVLAPPYISIYDRQCQVEEGGGLSATGRSQEKKEFDELVFGRKYY